MIPVTSTGHTSVDIGVNANLKLVQELSVDGDADKLWRTESAA